ncbi:ADP-ribosylglycohydrolase family protein [Leptothoe kymatousa]|uniref:ADP-ribosylglycohydrolase family protein n=1 Tax=Leptothoe kymatousa TAU-MAC 1615 TaxID=2364775 RepID=A0ABS5Y0T1_9CYAN|nr:ADP-ribosylglycohydrolase family protein [Leptothoe kymatousa]MBT9311421.1 ADP-ribosylglycohydrolase family protein [Leptothoe kymatousa TAU-MAC 1615]
MLGAILGDAIGSAHQRIKIQDFEIISPDSHWTENTIFMLATADYLLYGGDYEEAYGRWYEWYPKIAGGYNNSFSNWVATDCSKPYYSCRNDGAVRVIPIAYAFDTLKEVMEEAERSATVSHNHPEGVKGAQITAVAVFLAKTGTPKETMAALLTNIFGYDFQTPYESLQESYQYSTLAQDTVGAAVIAFLASSDFEDAIRKAVALGGDAKTLAAIAGGIAEAFYPKILPSLRKWGLTLLDEGQQDLITEFRSEYSQDVAPAYAA